MSKHHKSEMYVKANGEHVIAYKVFKAMSIFHVLNTLTKMGKRPSKVEHERKERSK